MKSHPLALALLLLNLAQTSAAEPPPNLREKEVAALEASDRISPPEGGSAVFIGDTIIRQWTTLAQDFPRVATVNHGLAGASIADCTRYFDRLVAPLKPRVVIFEAGGEELVSGKSPEQVAADFRAFGDKLQATIPFAKLIANSVCLTPARWAIREKIALTNAYLAAYCAADPQRVYIDLNSALLTSAGGPRADLYTTDRTNLVPEGYIQWSRLIAPLFDWRSTRFEKDIQAFEAADRTDPPALNGVLFTGASTVKFWRTLERDFPGVPTLNRGFGGAFLMDCVYYYNRVVAPYRPRVVVLSAGGNDLAFGHHPPEEIAADFEAFRLRIRATQPETKLICLGQHHSPLRAALHDQINRINELVAAKCAADPLCVFVDVNRGLLSPTGQLRPEIYRPDRLHLNDSGYAILVQLLKPLLMPYAVAPTSAGWRTLFDGTSLEAWRPYNKTAADPAGWTIQNETLAVSPPPPLAKNLITREKFGNFELELDWKISAGGNSGVMIRVQEDRPYPHDTGTEMQVLDNAMHPDGAEPKTSAGSLYGMYAPTRDMAKPVGEWNHVRIRAFNQHLEYWLNEEKVIDVVVGSEDWNQRILSSKFAKIAGYAAFARGGIVLQDHGNPVWYRAIRIRTLD